MAALDLTGLIRVGVDILTTTVNATTRKVLAQLGDVHRQTTDTDNAEIWAGPGGIVSRPPKPEAGKRAAQAVVLKTGDYDIVLGVNELRGTELYGELDHGETAVFAPGEDGTGQARILLKKNGAVAIYTTEGNTANGGSVTIQALPSGEIHIASSLGGISITSSKISVLSASGSGAEFSSSGVNIIGQTNVINGTCVLGDATATGVATQTSTLPLFVAMQAMFTAMQAFFNAPTIQALSAGTAPPVVPLIAAVQVLMALPTTFSTTIKASS